MLLRCSIRRFFCDNAECGRRIFAEQLPELAAGRARETPRLSDTLVEIGLECGGEPGSRLCAELGIAVSGDTILRRLRAMPPADRHAGNVIGVDDFAFRRGQRYGTIIVDHESGGVIDLLADRTSGSLEAWLAGRPVRPTAVTRDRSGVDAKAITAAVPDAVQVADRWHLLANCREALVRLLDRHHKPITEAMASMQPVTPPEDRAEPVFAPLPAADLPAAAPAPVEEPPSKNQQQSLDRRARRVARYEQVLELDRQGYSQRAIVRQLKMSRTQVLKLLHAGTFPERAKTHHFKQVDRYVDQLRKRWTEGTRDARELTRYIRTLGYTGGYDMVDRDNRFWQSQNPCPS